jgi:hypothetical protein
MAPRLPLDTKQLIPAWQQMLLSYPQPTPLILSYPAMLIKLPPACFRNPSEKFIYVLPGRSHVLFCRLQPVQLSGAVHGDGLQGLFVKLCGNSFEMLETPKAFPVQ